MSGTLEQTTGLSVASPDTGRRWTWLAIAAWTACMAALGASVVTYSSRAQLEQYMRGMEERAELMLDVSEATARAHLRNGKYHPGLLQELFDKLAGAPLVEALRLSGASNTTLCFAGRALDEDGDDYYFRSRTVDLLAQTPDMPGQHNRPMGDRGPSEAAGWLSLPEGPDTLTVALDTKRLREKIRATRWQSAGLGGVFALAALLGSLVIWARYRQARLRTDLLVARERAAHHEQLARLGAGLAHETKNPLGLVRGMAQSMLDADAPPAVREQAARMIDETDRIVGQINGFMTLARPKEPKVRAVALDGLFGGLTALVRQEAEEQGVRLTSVGNGLRVAADEEMLRRAILNLLLNALDACGTGAEVRLSAAQNDGGACVSVRDTGHGIPAADLSRVMEPYFSKKPGGTGLGLAIVEDIARAHGWSCRVVSEEGAGTEVLIENVRLA